MKSYFSLSKIDFFYLINQIFTIEEQGIVFKIACCCFQSCTVINRSVGNFLDCLYKYHLIILQSKIFLSFYSLDDFH